MMHLHRTAPPTWRQQAAFARVGSTLPEASSSAPPPTVTPSSAPSKVDWDAMKSPAAWAWNGVFLGVAGLGAYSGYKLAGGGVLGVAAGVVAAPVALFGTLMTVYIVGSLITGKS